MTTATDGPVVELGGIFTMPADEYHAHPASISSTGLKRLLPPYCPAVFRFGEKPSSDAFDFGKAAHRLVLGEGDEIAVAPYDNWTTKAAKEFRDEAHAEGKVPLLAKDFAKAQAMADAVAAHPWAGQLFTDGRAEQSLFWTHEPTGILVRCRYDWLRNVVEGRRLIIPDYKTAASAHPDTWRKRIGDYGYHQQAALYIDAAKALGLDPDPLFVFVVQEKAAPYLVSVIELHEDDIKLGRQLNERALRIYRDCIETNTWPGYGDNLATVELPTWTRITAEEYLG